MYQDIVDVPEILSISTYPSLNGLRSVSIVLVLFDHFAFNSIYKFQYKFLVVGHLGVYVFFVISGFLITTLLLKEKVATGTISLRYFYKRRFLRILPLVYLFLAVLLLLNQVFHLNISLLGFLGPILFLVNIGLFHNNWYTSHFWSLAYEEQFYLVFPFILKQSLRWYLYFIFLLLIMIIVLRQFWFCIL